MIVKNTERSSQPLLFSWLLLSDLEPLFPKVLVRYRSQCSNFVGPLLPLAMAALQLLLAEHLWLDLARLDESARFERQHHFEASRQVCRKMVHCLGDRFFTQVFVVLWQSLRAVQEMAREVSFSSSFHEHVARRCLPGPWRIGQASKQPLVVATQG